MGTESNLTGMQTILQGPPVAPDRVTYINNVTPRRTIGEQLELLTNPKKYSAPERLQIIANIGHKGIGAIEALGVDEKRSLANTILGEHGLLSILDLSNEDLPSFVNPFWRKERGNQSASYFNNIGGSYGLNSFISDTKRVISAVEFIPEDETKFQTLITQLIEGYDGVKNKLESQDDKDSYANFVVELMQSGFKHFGNSEKYIDFYFDVANRISQIDNLTESRFFAFIPVVTELEITENFGFQSTLKKLNPDAAAYFSDKWIESVSSLDEVSKSKIVESWLDTGNTTSFPLKPGNHLAVLKLFKEALDSGYIDTTSILYSDLSYDEGRHLKNRDVVRDKNNFIRAVGDFASDAEVFSEKDIYSTAEMERLIKAAESKFSVNNTIIRSIDNLTDAPDVVVHDVVEMKLEENEKLLKLKEAAKLEFSYWSKSLVEITEEDSYPVDIFKTRKFPVDGENTYSASSYLGEIQSFITENRVEGSTLESGFKGRYEVSVLIDLCDFLNYANLTDQDFQVIIDFISKADPETKELLENYAVFGAKRLIPSFYSADNYTTYKEKGGYEQTLTALEKLDILFEEISSIEQESGRVTIKEFINPASAELSALLGFLKGTTNNPENILDSASNNIRLDKFVGVLAGMYWIPRFRESLGVYVQPSTDEYEILEGRVLSNTPRRNCLPNYQIGGLLNMAFGKGTSTVIGGPTGSGKTYALRILFESLFPGNRSVPNAKVSRPFSATRNSTDGIYRVGFEVPDPNQSLADQSISELVEVINTDTLFADELLSGGTDLAASVIEYIQLLKRKRAGLTTVVTSHHVEELGALDYLLGESGLHHVNIIPISHEAREGMSSSFGPETYQRIGSRVSEDIARMIEELKQQIMFGTEEIVPPLQEVEYSPTSEVFDEKTIDELQLKDIYTIMMDSMFRDSSSINTNEISSAFTEFLKEQSSSGPEFFEEEIHKRIDDFLQEDSHILRDRLVHFSERLDGVKLAKRALQGIGSMDYIDKYELYSYLLSLTKPEGNDFVGISVREQEIMEQMKDFGLETQDLLLVNPENVVSLSMKLADAIRYDYKIKDKYPNVARMLNFNLNNHLSGDDLQKLTSDSSEVLRILLNKDKTRKESDDKERAEKVFSEYLNPVILDLEEHLGKDKLKSSLGISSNIDHLNSINLSALYALTIKNGLKGNKIFTKPSYDSTGNTHLSYSASFNIHLLKELGDQYIPVGTPEFSGENVVAQVKIGNQKAGKSASLISEAAMVAHTIISGYCPGENVNFKKRPKAIAARIIRSIGSDNYSQYETEARKLVGIYKAMAENPDTWVFIDEASNGVDKSTKQAVIA
ncbi:MAG TPA: ATP-binding protein, partial [Candidatus Dojkabacteria bacterium]|nr:ATP-binding protein [Candidatus Dojkabacteria bacterium]